MILIDILIAVLRWVGRITYVPARRSAPQEDRYVEPSYHAWDEMPVAWKDKTWKKLS